MNLSIGVTVDITKTSNSCHWLVTASETRCIMQDYPKLDKFKDALKQAAQTITTIKVVFADASANSGALMAFPL